MHDLVIENARIVDGLGNPAVAGALAVKDGRIAALGANVGPGHERLDAEGRSKPDRSRVTYGGHIICY